MKIQSTASDLAKQFKLAYIQTKGDLFDFTKTLESMNLDIDPNTASVVFELLEQNLTLPQTQKA